MGRIIDRDKNKRKIFPLDPPIASISKMDAYAKRISKAERLNVILLIVVVGLIILNGVILYGN